MPAGRLHGHTIHSPLTDSAVPAPADSTEVTLNGDLERPVINTRRACFPRRSHQLTSTGAGQSALISCFIDLASADPR